MSARLTQKKQKQYVNLLLIQNKYFPKDDETELNIEEKFNEKDLNYHFFLY